MPKKTRPNETNPQKDVPKEIADDNLLVDKRALFDIKYIANKIVGIRKKPLLLMFYSDSAGIITPYDIDYLESIFDCYKTIDELDLIIYTRGGDVSTSYRLAQLIRSRCSKLTTMIPIYSYSGGTMIALSSDTILMNRGTSCISPIDIQLGGKMGMPLINFDKFVEFLYETSHSFKFDDAGRVNYVTSLMSALMKIIPPLNMGEFYRMRKLNETYAKALLTEYMFRNDSSREDIASHIVKKLTSDCPTHSFDIDYHIAKEFGIKVDLMEYEIYKLGVA